MYLVNKVQSLNCLAIFLYCPSAFLNSCHSPCNEINLLTLATCIQMSLLLETLENILHTLLQYWKKKSLQGDSEFHLVRINMLINILIFLKKQDLKPVIWQILRDLHFHRIHSIPDLKCNYITKRLSITNWQNGVTFTWLMYYIMLIVCKIVLSSMFGYWIGFKEF